MKKYLPREYLDFVERLLKEYPARSRELENLGASITACCHLPTISEFPGGGGNDSEPERVAEAKERDNHYQWLSRHLEAVRRGLNLLNSQEMLIIELFFWEQMQNREICDMLNLDERWVRRLRTRALCKLVRYFFPLWVD